MSKPVVATTSSERNTVHTSMKAETESASLSRPQNLAATTNIGRITATPISNYNRSTHVKEQITLSAAMKQAILAIGNTCTDKTLIQSSNLLADCVAETDSRRSNNDNLTETYSVSHKNTWLQIATDAERSMVFGSLFTNKTVSFGLEHPIQPSLWPTSLDSATFADNTRLLPTIDNVMTNIVTFEAPMVGIQSELALTVPEEEPSVFIASAAPVAVTFGEAIYKLKLDLRPRLYTVIDQTNTNNPVFLASPWSSN
jgi:hypothetical protein